jgi:phospholipase/carboxylesterase
LFSLDHVEERRSRVSIPSSRAAWIDKAPINPIAQREFTHIHTEPGPGSQHMPLPADVAAEVLAKGWGEPHPTNPYIHDFELLMIYAPRSEDELEAVEAIITRGYEWTLDTGP